MTVALAAVALLVALFLPWAPGGIEGVYFDPAMGTAQPPKLGFFGTDDVWATWPALGAALAAVGAFGLVASVLARGRLVAAGLAALAAPATLGVLVSASWPIDYGAALALAAVTALAVAGLARGLR